MYYIANSASKIVQSRRDYLEAIDIAHKVGIGSKVLASDRKTVLLLVEKFGLHSYREIGELYPDAGEPRATIPWKKRP